jgi:methylphosphotriester-DNA--protein-cysteine methyltransferase
MLAPLKIDPEYEGFLFLAESVRNAPILVSHRHLELELNVVINGEITYLVDGRSYTSGRGTLLWMFPSQEHQLIHRTADAQYYVAVFKPDMIQRACRHDPYLALKADAPHEARMLRTVLSPQRFDFLQNLMVSTMAGSIDADVLNREGGFGFDSSFRYRHNDPDALNAGLRHLMLLGWRYQSEATARIDSQQLHPSVQKALTFLSEQDENESLESLARRCSVSSAYLSRMFRRQVGIPMNQYRNSLRLGRFWEFYSQETSMTLTEAMYAAGFGSYAQFYKVFRAQYGRGPRDLLNGESEVLSICPKNESDG